MITIATIQHAVCRHYGVGIADLLSEQRGRYARPRHVAMWLSRRLTRRSYAVLGRLFHRDPCTVHQTVAHVGELISTGKCPEAWRLLAELQRPCVSVMPQIRLAYGWVVTTQAEEIAA